MPAFEVVLRRPNRRNTVRYVNQPDAEVGDVLTIDGYPWVIVAKQPAFERRRIERIICVPRNVRTLR